ncbi:uncharacterized protein LOC135440631 [Drosophila montana]|uniref:uncharacterized protein LOC135440631 n=1 Tax=Drosophila montana TaxID=40370 RepID=UPI00313E24A4
MSRLPHIVYLLAALLLHGAETADYNVFLDEQLIQESCGSTEGKGNMALSELVETRLTTVLDSDYETLYISGDIIVKQALPHVPIKFEVDVSRWERGQWVPTFVTLKRDDFCKSLKDPFELWHLYYITQIPRQQRTCPPHQGQVYSFTNVSNRMLVENMPRWDIVGNLRAVVHFSAGDMKTCLLIYCTVSLA